MAVTNLYLNPSATGANDLNSGSTLAAPTHTYAGGTFVRATNTFTVASGNPSTDGFVSAGDYVSVYTTSGRSVVTFVMKVDSTTSTTIVGSATGIVYGVNTTVSETANATSLTIGGAWATNLPLGATLTAGGLGTFTVPQSTTVNFRGNLTIAASPTISMAGSTTNILQFDGYNTNPGDLDNDRNNSLAKPIWTCNSAISLTLSGTHQRWSNISVVGNISSTLWAVTGAVASVTRFRCENTSSNAAAVAFRCSNTINGYFEYGWTKCPTTASTNGVILIQNAATFVDVVAEGGGLAGFNIGANSNIKITSCVCLSNTGAGILLSTGGAFIFNTTVYGATVDCIKWTGTPTNGVVKGCRFSGLNGSTATTNGINNASGTNTNLVNRSDNLYYNVTNPEVGFGDSPNFLNQTSANPIVNSATDMTPVPGTDSINNLGIIFENESFYDYAFTGAVQPASGGGGIAIFSN